MSEPNTNGCVSEYFGCNVFSDRVMRERLPKNVYKSVQRTRQLGLALEKEVADVVANAMKDWAVEKGATHYTHWFQPMTGVTAESTTHSLLPTERARLSSNFRARSFLRASLTLPHSPQADSVQPLRQEAIPHGTLLPVHS